MSLIIDTVITHLPPKRKTTPSGWISFNAVCCHNNGTGMDKRQRGGIMINDGVSYHCFNCGFKASWQPGRKVTAKFKNLLKWINVSDELINKCSLEALRIEEDANYKSSEEILPTFIDKALPLNSKLLVEYLDNPPGEILPVLEYLINRKFTVDDYPFYWTAEDGFQNRLIVPFFYQGRIVGYTARKITDGKPKYISEQQPNYVFNLDRQSNNRNIVFVTEGPIDAICLDGCAVMSNEISTQQALLINSLKKEVVVVPDRDEAGKKLVNQAIELGWSVSMPEWSYGIKDVNDAVKHYGKLYTMWSIGSSKESMALKIQLRMKKWFGKE